MHKKFMIYLIISLFILQLCLASSTDCKDTACTGQYYDILSLDISGFNSNQFPVQYNTVNYTRVDISPNAFKSIIGDIDFDGHQDIITFPTATLIIIRDYTGIGLYSITLNETIIAQPSLVYSSTLNHPDIAFITSSNLSIYNYLGTKLYTYDYTNDLGIASSNVFGCTASVCSMDDSNGGATMGFASYNVYNGISLIAHNTSILSFSGGGAFIQVASKEIPMQTYNNIAYAIFCEGNTGSLPVYCSIINSYTGKSVYNFYPHSGSNFLAALYDYQAGFARMDGNYRFIYTDRATKSTSQYTKLLVTSDNFITTYINQDNTVASNRVTSDVVVGDYNSDGNSELCYLQNQSTGVSFNFLCWQTLFLSPLFNVSLAFDANISSFPFTFDIMEYVNNSPREFFAMRQGIIDIDYISGIIAMKFNSTIPIGAFTDIRSIKTMISNTALNYDDYSMIGYNFYIVDDTTYSYIAYPNNVSQCGGGFCTIYCPQNCNVNNTYLSSCSCINSISTCPNGYDACFSNKCVNNYNATLLCTESSQCPITAGICFSGHCVAAVCGDYNVTTSVTSGAVNSGSENALKQLFDAFFQGSVWLKFIIGMIIVIVVAIEAGNLSGGNPFVISIGGIFALVMVSLIGLIPIYVLILCIMLLVIFLLVSNVFFPGSSGAGGTGPGRK